MSTGQPGAQEPVPDWRSRVLRAFLHQVLGRVGSVFLGFVYVVLISRYLGPGSYGQLSAALAFAGVFLAFADFGVNSIVLVEAQGDESKLVRGVEQSLGLSLSYSLPVAALAYVTSGVVYGFGSLVNQMLAVLGVFLVSSTLVACYLPLFQFHHDFRTPAFAETASAALTLGAAGLIITQNAGLLAISAVVSGASAVRLLLTVLASRRLARPRPAFDVAAWARLLRVAAPVGMAAVIGVLYYRLDTVILSMLSDADQVGLYGLSYRYILLLIAFPSLLTTSSLASLAELGAGRPQRLAARTSEVLRGVVDLALPLTVWSLACAPAILLFIGGRAYVEGSVVLRLLVISALFSTVNTVLSACLIVAGFRSFLLWLGALMTALNVVLNLAFDSRGAHAAAWCIVVTEAVSTVLAWRKLRDALGIRYRVVRPLARLAVVMGVASAALLTRNMSAPPSAVIFAASWLALLVATRFLPPPWHYVRSMRHHSSR